MKFSLLTVIAIIVSMNLFAQSNRETAFKFVELINNYESDSLYNLLDEEFLMTRTYSKMTNDKVSFINNYLPQSKNTNAKYKIIKDTLVEGFIQLLVEDKSDYFSYLGLVSPLWKMNIMVNNGKVKMVSMDTTQHFSNYIKDIKQKDAAFNNWLQAHYPNETSNSLFAKGELLMTRLKEYASTEKKD